LPQRTLWHWSADEHGRHLPLRQIIVADGVVILVTTSNESPPSGFVVALDAADGTTLWELPVSERPRLASNGQHLAVFEFDHLRWIEVRSGHVLWKKRVPESGDVMVAYDTIYLEDGSVRALSALDGSMKWEFEMAPDDMGYSGPYDYLIPSATPKRVFVCWNIVPRISCVLSTSGKEVWQRSLAAPVETPPVVCGDSVLVRTEHRLLSLDMDTGRPAWSTSVPPSPGGFPIAVHGDAIYVAGGREIYELDASSGSVVSKFTLPDDLPGFGSWPLLATEKFLVVAGIEGQGRNLHTKISIVDRDTKRLIWSRSPAPDDIPGQIAIADDRLFFASSGGVTAFGP
jgi:outer membrane protein assembly factor BamB